MTDINSSRVGGDWRGVVGTIRRALKPTERLVLCGESYTVRSESRGDEDRDYAILRDLARDKQCVLDIGANVGRTTLVMARSPIAADGLLYTFEASEAACRLIQDNVALNGLAERVIVINALVAERSGLTIDFYGDAASGGASIIPGYLNHYRPMRKVSLAVDDFVDEFNCAPDFIKIDVEGAEARVLRGLTRTMREIRPLIFLELHSWDDVTLVDQARNVLDLLKPLDYQLIYLRTKEIVTDPEAFAGRGRCHVIACPAYSPFLDELAMLDTTSV